MKTKISSSKGCLIELSLLSVSLLGITLFSLSAGLQPQTVPALGYSVIERGPHHKVWAHITAATNTAGAIEYRTNTYTELATGLHYLEDGQWVDSTEQIEPHPQGAFAGHGQHRVLFSANLNSAGSIDLTTSDSKRLRSHILGLSYYDYSSGKSVLIAEVKSCEGKLSGNQVIYEDAFTDFAADVRYTYTKAGLEQDVILRQQPPSPAEYGLNADSTVLQVLTEYLSPPLPTVTHNGARPGEADDTLEFGAMTIGPGKAFSLGPANGNAPVPVRKQWLRLEDRDFLVEEVSLPAIQKQLKDLPKHEGASVEPATNSVRHIVSARRLVPSPRLAQIGRKNMKFAKLTPPAAGFVMDWVTLSSSGTNYTLQGDTTYYLSGPVNLAGTTIFEGGAVLKYATNASLALASVNCLGTPYRPVIMTAKDDNTVGATISGSTGNPTTNYYANPALSFANGSPTNWAMSNFRIAFAQQAVYGSCISFQLYLSHGQIVNCLNGIQTPGQGNIHLRNVLFSKFRNAFDLQLGNFDAQNVTFDAIPQGPPYYIPSYLIGSGSSPYSSGGSLVNCILVNLTAFSAVNPSSVTGHHNGFYNNGSSPFGTSQIPSSTNPFRMVGAGNYYLTNNSVFVDTGTASIDTNLLADLRMRTTFPPVIYTNLTIYMQTNWTQIAARDTNNVDLGYHYDALDYLCSQIALSGPTLTLNPGVAVGLFGAVGFSATNSAAAFTSDGRADAMNRIAWYPSVQEQSIKLNNLSTFGSTVFDLFPYSTGSPKIINLYYTDLPMQGGRQHLLASAYPYSWPIISAHDSWFRGVDFTIYNYYYQPPYYAIPQVSLLNNLFERSTLGLVNGYIYYFSTVVQNPLTANLYNNLFWQSAVGLAYMDSLASNHLAWTVNDNLFDQTSISFSGDGNYLAFVTRSNNGFYNSPTYTNLAGSANVLVTNLSYANGRFGPWYIGSASPTLQDAGSRTAGAAGLYHHTIQTNQVKEANTTVDIGFHYVAVDGNGNPIDTDGDGVPDYVEDKNGNGVYESPNESPWYCYASPSGLVSWWPAEGDSLDGVSTNHGVLFGTTSYSAGKVGQAFNGNGAGSGVLLGNRAGLQLQDLTIEAWVKRASTSSASADAGGGEIFSYGYGGYGLGMNNNGTLFLTRVGLSNVTTTNGVSDTNFHHIAVTKSGSSVIFYVDGLAYPAAAYNPGFTFSTAAAVGARGDTMRNSFYGLIDECAVYSRALTAVEIQAINAAGVQGKCLYPPAILVQPTNQAVTIGNSATLSVLAVGTSLRYQWSQNGSSIIGATTSVLAFTNVQSLNAGSYSVLVTNRVGSSRSATVALTVNAAACSPCPAGAIGWWAGEDSAEDNLGSNPLGFQNGATYATAKVGRGFSLDGVDDRITAPGSPCLDIGPGQDFSLEAWIQPRTNSTSYGVVTVLSKRYAQEYVKGYEMYLQDGKLAIQLADAAGPENFASSGPDLRDGLFHHVAITVDRQSSTGGKLYVDGRVVLTFNPTGHQGDFSNPEPLRIGNHPTPYLNCFFKGVIDEPTIYKRALYSTEVQAIYNSSFVGKCSLAPSAPVITVQPTNQTLAAGSSTTLQVGANGSPALYYQWFFEGAELAGATSPSLALNNVQPVNSGTYHVLVGNSVGASWSSDAIVTVHPPGLTNVWVEDSIPAGATPYANNESWNWLDYYYDDTCNFWWCEEVWPNSGQYMHMSDYVGADMHQHYFAGATTRLTVNPGDTLFAYIKTDPAYPPQEVMLQWRDTSGNWYRAFWGSDNLIGWPATQMGDLPPSDEWIRLEVPASALGLQGLTLDGMAFTLYDGHAAWDSAGTLNPDDADNDNISDTWERLHFGPNYQNNPNAAANADPDSDGLTNLQEYRRGTDPNNPDTDYDGRSDSQEVLAGTNPLNGADHASSYLGTWSFDAASVHPLIGGTYYPPPFSGDQGQSPLAASNLELVFGTNGNAVRVSGSAPVRLAYRDVETNGLANINCANGTIRFWFSPDWTSGQGGGPGTQARLFEVGSKTATNGWSSLLLNSTGTQIMFFTGTNGLGTTNLTASINWTAGQWHQLALTYSSTGSTLYIDGSPIASGTGVQKLPNSGDRSQNGFNLGSDSTGNQVALGSFDEVKTFNYPQSASEVASRFSLVTGGSTANPCSLYPIALNVSILSQGYVDLDPNGPGNFGWLNWDGSPPSVPTLETSLTPPGDSYRYRWQYDHDLRVGDAVFGSTGDKCAVKNKIKDLIDDQVVLTLPVWSHATLISQGQGNLAGRNFSYQVDGFAAVLLTSFDCRRLYFTYLGPTNCSCNADTTATPLSNLTLCPGANGSFSTIASGTGPFVYSWTKDGSTIPGQTSATLSLNSVAATDSGTYCVIVKGPCNSVTNCATLTVVNSTSITPLTPVVVCPGANVSFSTVASGSGPFTYGWTKDGILITGQTGSSLPLNNVSSANAGLYCVTVTGACGSASSCAALTVKEVTAATPLANLVLPPGGSGSFSTVASGSGPITYSWTRNGLPIGGQSSSLTLNSVTAADVGTYCVTVTADCGSVNRCATLTVTSLSVTAVDHTYTMNQDSSLPVSAPGLLAGASNPSGAPLQAGLTQIQPTHGSANVNPDGSFTYTPTAAYVGLDSFRYFAHDSSGQYQDGFATATILVNPVGCSFAALNSVNLNLSSPYTVTAGATLTGTVQLNANASKGGQVVTLTSNNPKAIPDVAAFVPEGSQTANFTVRTVPFTDPSGTPSIATISGSYNGVNVSASPLTINPLPNGDQPIDPKFNLTVFASGFSDSEGVGPVGVAKAASGKVLVSVPFLSKLYIFPNDQDGQVVDDQTPRLSYPLLGPDGSKLYPYGLARAGDKVYAACTAFTPGGMIAELSDDGAVTRVIVATDSSVGLLGIAVNPQNGHLIASDYNDPKIYDVDPATGDSRALVDELLGRFDGVSVSLDGRTVYTAWLSPWGAYIVGFDTSSGADVFSLPIDYADGAGVGQGSLAGQLFVNCNNGKLVQVDLDTADTVVIAENDTERGDLVAPDSDGTLFITQSDRILRLIPPPGAAFGPISATISVRNDQASGAYAPPITLGNANPVGTALDPARFDLRGLAGDVQAALMIRSGSVQYTSGGGFDQELGIQPLPPDLTPASFGVPTHYNTALPPGSPSTTLQGSWLLSQPWLADLKQYLGGEFKVHLVDRVSSACSAFTLNDTPQMPWPQLSNTLTLLIKGATDPQIPQGQSLDISIPGPAGVINGDWQISLNHSLIASSGDPNGWDVEDDHNAPGTAFNGAIVTVPPSAAVASGYQVVLSGAHPGTGYFEVVPADAIHRAPSLLPIALSQNPALPGASLTATIALDSPAGPDGAIVALASSSSFLPAPASVTIAAGATSADVALTVSPGATPGTLMTLSASFNGRRQAIVRVKSSGISLPVKPTGLFATSDKGVVKLAWNTQSDALSYNVKRSRASGANYTLLYSGLKTPNFVDATVINGLTYYYVVSASNDAGEGPNSDEASATPNLGQVDVPGIHYDLGSHIVTLSDAIPGAFIHYTLDGSIPTEGSPVYTGPFEIHVKTIVTAKAFKQGYLPSIPYSETEDVTITPYAGKFIACGYFNQLEALPVPYPRTGLGQDVSWVKGEAFYASHYSLGALNPNTPLVITMSSGQVDSFLYLFDDLGNLLASNDDQDHTTANSKLTYPVPATPAAGYFLEATTASAHQFGYFTLFVDCNSGLPSIQVLHNGSPLGNGDTVALGTLPIGGGGRTFLSIENSGDPLLARGLNIGLLTMSGDFSVRPQLIPKLPPQTIFEPVIVSVPTLTFGSKSGTLTIPSDDPGGDFVVHFTATVSDPVPVVSLTAPLNNASVSTAPFNIALSANATASTRLTINSVQFFAADPLGGALPPIDNFVAVGPPVTTPTSGNTYTFAWNNVPIGDHYLLAKATDSSSQTGDTYGSPVLVHVGAVAGTPTIATIPPTGPFSGNVQVTLGRGTLPDSARIEYTTDGGPLGWYVYRGPFVLSFDDTDANGHVTLRARGTQAGFPPGSEVSSTLTINPAPTAPDPIADISSPSPEGSDPVTNRISIVGTAKLNGAGSLTWRLQYQPSGDPNAVPVTIASGTSPVEGAELGIFDPTMLVNGLYDILLITSNDSGNTQTAVVTVAVQGNQKVGNFTLSFVDMTVPVMGVPIEITRTYDSRDKGQGDFGIGWRLGLKNIRIQKSPGKLGENWFAARAGTAGAGSEIVSTGPHTITITFPNGEVDMFEAALNPSFQPFYPIEGGTVVFVPSGPTKAELRSLADNDVLLSDTEGDVQFIDSSDQVYDSNDFELIGRDKKVYRFNVVSGLISITDPNGNVVSFVDGNGVANGIYKSTLANPTPIPIVSFSRELDAPHRITSITDPNSKSVQYLYGTAGQSGDDLSQVIDRLNHGTTFKYDGQHNLIDMIAPDNKSHMVRNTYDDDGRLIQTMDALGHVTTYEHDAINRIDSVTDPLQNKTSVQYDENGNILKKTQTLKIDDTQSRELVTAYEYGDPNNPYSPTMSVDPLNRTNWMSYSPSGDLLTLMDGLKRTTTYTYNGNHQVTSITDASDKPPTVNEYDGQGNLTKTTDGAGAETINVYLPDGRVSSTTNALGKFIVYGYDDAASDPGATGLPTSMTDENGAVTLYKYDLNGNPTHVITTRTVPDGGSTITETIDKTSTYDDNDKLLTTTIYAQRPGHPQEVFPQTEQHYNELGLVDYSFDYTHQQTFYYYDDDGRLIQTTTPDNQSTYVSYDAAGRRQTITDKASRVTQYVYDSLGRQTAVLRPDTTTITNQYDDAGQLVAVTDPNGHTNQYVYDDAGQRVQAIDTLGRATIYEYDGAGRQTSITDANTNKITFDYDNAGRLGTTTHPDQNGAHVTSSISYDLLGRKTALTDASGVITGYAYDPVGRLRFVTNAFNTAVQMITEYQYDEAGNLVRQLDAKQHTTKFEYDAIGRRTRRILPDTRPEVVQYSIVNNTLEVQRTDFNQLATVLNYDAMGRLITKSILSGTPPTKTVKVQYDYYPTNGLRSSMADSSGTTTYTYDVMDRLALKQHTVLGDLNYTYDPAGNLRTISSFHGNLSGPTGVSLTYHWDELNRLASVEDATGNVTTYNYDKVGNLQQVGYPTSYPVTNAYTYNTLNRLAQMAANRQEGPSSVPVASFDYNPDPSSPARRLDLTGVRRVAVETIHSSPVINREVQYSYDALYRLTQENLVSGSLQGTVVYDSSTGYQGYDQVGNRRSRKVSTTSLRNAGITDFNNVAFDVDDRISGNTYDFNGNTTVEALPASIPALPQQAISPDAGHPDQYDFEDHLVQRANANSTVQIGYDGDGNRVSRLVTGQNADTRYYLVDDRNPSGYAQVLEELIPDPLDSTKVKVDRVYNWGHNLISQARGSGGGWILSYFGYDGHGNVRFLMADTGAISDTYTYDAFGILIDRTGSTPNNYLFCGEQFDFYLGEYYLRARYLNPNSGRFWTMDTYEGNQTDPLTLHKYVYVFNNPLNLVDPSGRITVEELKEAIVEGGHHAAEAVANALKTIAEGGEGAEPLGSALVNVGPGIVTSIFHNQAQSAAVIAGRRIQVQTLYPLARAGALSPRGPLAKIASSGNFLLVDFGEDQMDKNRGMAPLEFVAEVDGNKEFILVYLGWRDLGNGKAAITMYYPIYDKVLKKLVPDPNNPVPIDNVPIRWLFGLAGWSTGVSYTIEINSDF